MSNIEVAKVKALKTLTLPDGSSLHIVRERINKLIKRIEVEGVVVHIGKGTPTRKDIVKALSELYNKNNELIVVRFILSEYGIGMSKFKAHIYESMDRLRYFEPKHILERHKR